MRTWFFRDRCPGAVLGVAHSGVWIACVCVLLATGSARAQSQQPTNPHASQPSAQQPSASHTKADEAVDQIAARSARLADAASTPADRRAAAAGLLDTHHDTRARKALLDALRSGKADPEGRDAVLAALAAMPVAPAGLWHEVVTLAMTTQDEDQLGLVLDAAASFRTRAAAQLLLGFTADEQPPAIRERAFAGLARLSGRIELNHDGPAWQRWLIGMIRLDEAAWTNELIRGLTSRLAYERQQRDLLAQRLVQTDRALWLNTPPEQRSAMLAQLVADPIPELRALGFDLVRQELASAHPIQPEVAQAVAGLLGNESWRVRADATVLIGQMAPPDAGARLLAALRTERDERVARALLAAMARWPSPEARETLIAWLERDGSTAQVAAAAVWALQRENLLTDQLDIQRVVDALRFLEPSQLNAPACRLLVTLGDDTDRSRIAQLLTASDPAQRLMAAEALVTRPEILDLIAASAREHSELAGVLARGIGQHRLNAAGFALLDSIASIPKARHDELLIELGHKLPTADLAASALGVEDLPLRQSLLAMLIDPARRPAPDAGEAQVQAYRNGLGALIETRLTLGQLDPAIEAVAALRTYAGEDVPVPSLATLIGALLDAQRFDDAVALGGDAQVWLDQLERLVDGPMGSKIASSIAQRFATTLTPEQSSRLTNLQARLPTAVTDAESTPPPAPDEGG